MPDIVDTANDLVIIEMIKEYYRSRDVRKVSYSFQNYLVVFSMLWNGQMTIDIVIYLSLIPFRCFELN